MSYKIDSQAARKRLTPRREPYWHKLTQGRYLGFRRTASGSGGSWVARFQDDTSKKTYRALGESLDYDSAVSAALKWFAGVSHVADSHYRVSDAVADYVRKLELHNKPGAGRIVELRLKKNITASLARTELAKLTTVQLNRWHQALVRENGDAADTRKSKAGANKLLSTLRAALNLAFRNGLAASDREWRKVTPFKNANQARTLFLTDEQVRATLDHTSGAFNSLVRVSVLTGARYGELRAARIEDFHPEHGTITLNGKTGERECYLSDETVTLFQQLAGNRPGDAFLLVKDDGSQWRPGHQFEPMKKVVAAAGLPVETVLYSLRHYHISKALLAGIPTQVIAENVGTSVAMIEKHYGKFMPKDRRRLLNQVVLL